MSYNKYILSNFKPLYIAFIVVKIVFLSSCGKNQVKENEVVDGLSFSNIHFPQPDNCHISYEDEMALFVIEKEGCEPLKAYNFGNSISTTEQNIARWQSQLDTVHETTTTWLHHDYILLAEIKGILNNEEVSSFGVIIPTTDGPFYLKCISPKTNEKCSKSLINELLNSITFD